MVDLVIVGYTVKDAAWFVNSVLRDVETQESKKCWILGAGASYESGIPIASDLTHEFSCDLLGLDKKTSFNDCLDNWSKADSLKQIMPDLREAALLSKDDRALREFLSAAYFDVYAERFAGNPKAGYRRLSAAMSGATPSYGYFVLARLLGASSGIVITVNFDNLIADALYLTGKQFPRIIDHERLAELCDTQDNIVQVCKIHRDLLKSPMSTSQQLDRLQEQWTPVLDEIFKSVAPIIVGYGGNDRTLMNYLSETNLHYGGSSPIWLYYTHSTDIDQIRSELPKHIASYLDRSNGFLVPYDGFDMIFYLASIRLGLGEVSRPFEERTKQIRTSLDEKLRTLTMRVVDSTNKEHFLVKEIVKTIQEPEVVRTVQDWIILGHLEHRLNKKLEVYTDAIEEKPHQWLYNNRGTVFADLKRYSEAIADYTSAIKINPLYARAFFNRACSFALSHRVDDAINDLNRVLDLSLSQAVKARFDSDLDGIRQTPSFKKFISRLNEIIPDESIGRDESSDAHAQPISEDLVGPVS